MQVVDGVNASPNRSRRQSQRLSRNVTYVLGPDEEPEDLPVDNYDKLAGENSIKTNLLDGEQRIEALITEKADKKAESLPLYCRQTDKHAEYCTQYFGVQPRLLIDMVYEHYLDRVEEFMNKLFDYVGDKKGLVVDEEEASTFSNRVIYDLDAHFDVIKYDTPLKCVFRLPNTHLLKSDLVLHEAAASGANEECNEAAIDLQIQRLEERLLSTQLERARVKADKERVRALMELCQSSHRIIEAERIALSAFAQSAAEKFEAAEKLAPTQLGTANKNLTDDGSSIKSSLRVLKNAADSIASLHESLKTACP